MTNPNSLEIKAVTDSELPLEVVDKRDVRSILKSRNFTHVCERQLKSSDDMLYSPSFARCNAVSFIDYDCQKGVLAHNWTEHDPYYFLTGQWSEQNGYIEDPKKIFRDMNRVLAINVSWEHAPWPENRIKGVVKDIGIVKERFIHIPIKSKERDRYYWRDVALDVREGQLYILPSDFDYGLKFDIKREINRRLKCH